MANARYELARRIVAKEPDVNEVRNSVKGVLWLPSGVEIGGITQDEPKEGVFNYFGLSGTDLRACQFDCELGIASRTDTGGQGYWMPYFSRYHPGSYSYTDGVPITGYDDLGRPVKWWGILSYDKNGNKVNPIPPSSKVFMNMYLPVTQAQLNSRLWPEKIALDLHYIPPGGAKVIHTFEKQLSNISADGNSYNFRRVTGMVADKIAGLVSRWEDVKIGKRVGDTLYDFTWTADKTELAEAWFWDTETRAWEYKEVYPAYYRGQLGWKPNTYVYVEPADGFELHSKETIVIDFNKNLLGDIDKNREVDIVDCDILRYHYDAGNGLPYQHGWYFCDLDKSGWVGIKDLVYLARNYAKVI